MNLPTISAAITIGTALVGGGWYAANNFASKEEVTIVAYQSGFILDKQIESLLAQKSRLESKKVKTQDDRDQIKYLREEIERTRQIKRGK